ncbi:MAG: adenylate kinase [Actinomycetaceae bacterium]|nr:adenylate kinase [Actinomycetaceae bacterium]
MNADEVGQRAPILILLGAPGAGKGTQAKRIAQALNIPAISTGAIFRQNMADNTELGRRAREYMDAGEFVPDTVTNPMVSARLNAPDTAGGYLLDGYPRTLDQAHYLRDALAQRGREVSLVIEIVTDEEEVVQRLLKRAQQENRSDDSEPVIRHRMEVYREQTEPMATYYADQDKLVQIDGIGSVDEVWERIRAVLDESGIKRYDN